ncbi:Ectoine synthase [Amycolatopsis rubida]|uniref:L-ectoine synthase n=1 Tax=Amycolatopsis rubida TaxID=112413 RepID=A0A1I5V4K5_9PSEU|nr:Ectoine synthase [Amycolatopsis rubida]
MRGPADGPVPGRAHANHIEAVFITSGEGEIEDLATGEVHQLKPGTLYLLNDHDKHQVRPKTEIKCVCVFNPPVTGREVHDENGAYPLAAGSGWHDAAARQPVDRGL